MLFPFLTSNKLSENPFRFILNFRLTATMYVGQKEAECLETALQKLIDITEDDKERKKAS